MPLVLGACAPRLQQIGPAIDPPALTATAFHTADGVDLPLRKWLPREEPYKTQPKAVILALHGFICLVTPQSITCGKSPRIRSISDILFWILNAIPVVDLRNIYIVLKVIGVCICEPVRIQSKE